MPVRFSEPGLLHRNELSGALHGLMRVRQFCQDDAHLFVMEDQIQDEVTGCLEFAKATYDLFGFDAADFTYELSTRPENRLGTDEMWDRAEGDLRTALAAYHAGQGNVDRWARRGTGIEFPETQAYVDGVVRARDRYRRAYGDELAAR